MSDVRPLFLALHMLYIVAYDRCSAYAGAYGKHHVPHSVGLATDIATNKVLWCYKETGAISKRKVNVVCVVIS